MNREGVPTLTPAERANRIQTVLEAPAPPTNRAHRRQVDKQRRANARRVDRAAARVEKAVHKHMETR